jgi:hypothetical protein
VSSTGERIRKKAVREARKARKHVAVRRLPRHQGDPLVVFGIGCQRSGTTMLGQMIDRSMDTWVYHEHDRRAFRDYRLRTGEVDSLARWSGRPVAVFKSIVDAQWADRFLERHAGSRAIWICRRYPDVARSAIVKWGDHQQWLINGVRRRAFAELGWRSERLADHVVTTIDRVHRPDLTVQEGAALFWWMRNSILWDRDLAADDRVLIVRYEDLVTDPVPHADRVFAFLGVPFDPSFVSDATPRSVRDEPLEGLSDEIRELCDTMQLRLDEAYAESLRRHPLPAPVPA